jgi:hypothetical protein
VSKENATVLFSYYESLAMRQGKAGMEKIDKKNNVHDCTTDKEIWAIIRTSSMVHPHG